MRYDIRLRIGYDYAPPVRDARHVLRLTPRTDRGQTLEAARLVIHPTPSEHRVDHCFFGNRTEHVLLRAPHASLSVTLMARVGVARGLPALDTAPPLCEVVEAAALSRGADGTAPAFLSAAGRLVAPQADAGAFIRQSLSAGSLGPGLLAAARAIRDEFAYEPGFSDLTTSVTTVLREKRGVCQDFAHLMIAGLRHLGIPAAYVSGFLRTEPPDGAPRVEGADAMHAWVEAWLGPDLGWVGFDPTNGCVVEDGHIAVAIGRDYADVAPVAGVVTTMGGQAAFHAVDVVPQTERPAAWQAALDPR
uniref:Putative IMP dehydrogenase/GMP reductase n=2 Tax=Aureimonas frigidaquae TaxID=424757 RepID=A0A0N7KXV3_9HYPH|nr:putative IMP dehydrogenase/GMP reductase [Aureimonas frigidaquae]